MLASWANGDTYLGLSFAWIEVPCALVERTAYQRGRIADYARNVALQ